MKNLLVFAFAGVLFYGCSNSKPKAEATDQPQQSLIEITNDMENASAVIPSWINEKTVFLLKEPAAHSGEFAAVTNDTIEYSYAYMELFKNINTGLPKSVVVSGWIYTTVAKPQIGMILNISENNVQYDWKVFPLADNLTEPGKWVEFTTTFYFDKPLKEEQEVKLFAWNQSKKAVYLDDLKISFQY
jgi:hypothetical protein